MTGAWHIGIVTEVAAWNHRAHGTSIRTTWVREPGKRQVERSTVRALVNLGLLTDRDGAAYWWLTPAGRDLAEQATREATDE